MWIMQIRVASHLSSTHWIVSPTSCAKCKVLDCGRMTSISTIRSSLYPSQLSTTYLTQQGVDTRRSRLTPYGSIPHR